MARTPIFRTLEQLVLSFNEQENQREDELAYGRDREISRRRMLKGIGTLAGVAMLNSTELAWSATPANKPRIAIVGGGISGLSAALTLKDAGYASSVYEATGRVGGRMHSNLTFWDNNQSSEWCGEFIDTGHKTILQLAQRFGLLTTDFLQAQPQGSTDTLYFLNSYYPQTQFYNDFKPVYATLKGQVQAIGSNTTHDTINSSGQFFDAMSLYQWIENYVPGGHGSKLGLLLDSAYNEEYGLDTVQQSSLNLITMLGYQVKPGKVSILGKSDQRYGIIGGNEKLPQAIATYLGTDSLKPNQRLTTISKNQDSSFTLTFASGSSRSTVVADRVIMTIPFSVLRNLNYSNAGFDSLKKTAITNLGYGTNSKLSLQFSQRYWNQSGPWGISNGNTYTDLPFQNAWDSTTGRLGTSGILTTLTGGTSGAAFVAHSPYTSTGITKYVTTFLSQLERIWPGVSAFYNGRATLSTPWSDQNLLGSYSCWKVGQYTLFSGYEGARQGRCHFAGEHCATYFQGYMEGGAQEGIRAAKEILADYKTGQIV
jgi:monoamine oxidase